MAPPKEEKPTLSMDPVQISSSSSDKTSIHGGCSLEDEIASSVQSSGLEMALVKHEITPPSRKPRLDLLAVEDFPVIGDGEFGDLTSFDSDEPCDANEKKENHSDVSVKDFVRDGVNDGNDDELPDDFLEPLDSPIAASPADTGISRDGQNTLKGMAAKILRQFWKSGKYDAFDTEEDNSYDFAGSMEHVRVHPKFLHSNATSHKWALGAIAELLDNSLDEVVHGATMVSLDMIPSPRDGRPMLVIEDDGGGMDPEQIRKCMSLGYSIKSKFANTIGQYGNGFKTSTMRLGADVLVLSRTKGKTDGSSLPTQSIGLLSYTFLTATGQDDITVPMVDYEIQPFGLRKLVRGTLDDWNQNLETILQWSPYNTEQDLFNQLCRIKGQGTIVTVYNLWEDEQGDLELDFDADPHDIQLRGTNRNERNIWMASRYASCKHYFTYKYSLRSYASILYLRLPKKFRIMLRGKQVMHHRIVNDLMFPENVTYRPHKRPEISQKDSIAVVTLGFVKDAREHIDVQGFNVYHKNRLIRPFWRVWINPSSQGRGIVGVLEANFVEPAHDKQGFERTIVFTRLETRLVEMQKNYWSKNCTQAGYVGYMSKKKAPSKPVDHNPATRSLNQNKAQFTELPTSASSLRSGAETPVAMNVSKFPVMHQTTCSLQTTTEFSNAASGIQSSGQEVLSSKPQACYPISSLARMNRIHEPNIRSVIEALAIPSSSAEPEGQASHVVVPESITGKERIDQVVRNSSSVPQPGINSLPIIGTEVVSVSMNRTESLKNSLLNPLTDLTVIGDEGSSNLSAAKSLRSADFPYLLEHEDRLMSLDDLLVPPECDDLASSGFDETICPSPLQRGDASVDNGNSSRIEASVGKSRGLSQKRSMLQLKQSHARAAMLSAEGRQPSEKIGSIAKPPSVTVGLGANVNAIQASDGRSVFSSSIITPSPESTETLKVKLEVMKQRALILHKEVDKVFNERDVLRLELQEERRRQAKLEEELKKKLQTMLLRASQLEAENKLLESSYV